jgi:hypothetical protein
MRRLLPVLLLIGACSKGPDADLPSIAEARSLAAEWAMVNELAAAGRLTPTYTATMRQNLRAQLRSTASSLTQSHSDYAQTIQSLVGLPDDAPPRQLEAAAAKLKHVENQLQSA